MRTYVRHYILFFSAVFLTFAISLAGAEPGLQEKLDNPAEDQEHFITDETDKNEIDGQHSEKESPVKKEQEKITNRENEQADSIERVLRFGLHSERRDVIKRILSIKNRSVQERLARTLTEIIKKDDNPEVINEAISVLGELKFKEAADAIAPHLLSENREIKITSVYALSRLDAGSHIPKLIDALKQQDLTVDSNLTEAIIIVLGDFKAVEIYDFAEEAIHDRQTTENIRQQLVLMLGKLDSPKPKDLLIDLFTDEHENVTIRSYAVNSLGRLGIKDAIPEIHNVLDHIASLNFRQQRQFYTLNIYSLAALARLGDADIVPRLQDYLKSDNVPMRLRAISLLQELDDKTSVDILKYRMEHDPEPRVRKAAREALVKLGVETDGESGTPIDDSESPEPAPGTWPPEDPDGDPGSPPDPGI